MATLRELDAHFLRRLDEEGEVIRWDGVSFADAEGVAFLCPKCFAANGGRVGTHQVWCWRPSVPQTVDPIPGRWEFEGTGLDDLTLVAGSSSVLLTSGCQAHFFVRNGHIEGC